MGELLSWWLAIELTGVVALPLAATLFARLPDAGWSLSKPLGLLIVGWLIWLPLVSLSALPYTRGWIVATWVGFALGNAALLRLPEVRLRLLRLLRKERFYLVATELTFAGAFALMAYVRSFTPAVVDTEKFMDVAFISAIWRAPHLPPPDPWLSGFSINYYYFGHFLIATLAKALGTQPGTAFNIGIALVFALTAVAVLGVAANLVAALRRASDGGLRRTLPWAAFSVLLVLVLGNLNGAQVWWQQATSMSSGAGALLTNPWQWWLHRDLWLQYNWWAPSRVVPNTINEFPAFSFVLADLHAHVLALPFATLAVGIALNLLLASGTGILAFGRGAAGIVALVSAAVCLGALYAINGWDLPTYLCLALLALALQQWLAHGRQLTPGMLFDFLSAGVLLVALSMLLYLPFYRDFVSPSMGIGLVAAADRSPIGDELAIFGLPLFILGSLMVVALARWAGEALVAAAAAWQQDNGTSDPLLRWLGARAQPVGAAVVVVAVGWLVLVTAVSARVSGWTLVWAVLLVLGCAALVLRLLARAGAAGDSHEVTDEAAVRARLWLYCLFGTTAALVAAAELVYLRDIFNARMNTVFKLYYQAWLLLGLASGPALARLLPAARAELARLVPALGWPALGAQISPAVPLSREASGHAARVAPAQGGARLAHALARTEGWLVRREPAATSARKATLGDEGEPLPPAALPEAGGTPEPLLPGALRWLRAGGILLWIGVLLLLGAATAIYPVLAVSARTASFSLPRTLDGTAYMATDPVNAPAGCNGVVGAGSNHGDNAAIAWLNTHVQGEAVIVEAPGCEWTHYSRISAFTGLPTLLGWPGGHEGEWRINWLARYPQGDLFGQRLAAIAAIYTNPDETAVMGLLREYHVRYVYVGFAERQLYATSNLGRFARYLKVVYAHDGITIYQVP